MTETKEQIHRRLGRGILKPKPDELVKTVVEWVKEYDKRWNSGRAQDAFFQAKARELIQLFPLAEIRELAGGIKHKNYNNNSAGVDEFADKIIALCPPADKPTMQDEIVKILKSAAFIYKGDGADGANISIDSVIKNLSIRIIAIIDRERGHDE